MHKSLIDLKKAIKFREEEAKQSEAEPKDSPEPLAEGEAISGIKDQRERKHSLEEQMAELTRKEKELNLRVRILNKKAQLEKIQLKFDLITEEDSHYTDKIDKDGYTQLRDEKWQNDFQELIIKLKNIELDEVNGTVDLLTSQEAKANVTKQIKKLIAIKKKNKTYNNMNKLKRGIQKTMKGIGSLSNEISKLTGGMSKFGNQVGGGSGGKRRKGSGEDKVNSTDWENFFSDEPKRTKSTKTTKKRKGKKSKKRKKSKKSKTTKTQKKSNDSFGGFSF